MVLGPGPEFERFFFSLDLGFKRFKEITVLNPYADEHIKQLTGKFIRHYYRSASARVLVLGINPGRKGGGITGIPFTDPVALSEICGINNNLKQERELSSTFIYEMINTFGGPDFFYDNVLLSAVSPLGFVKNDKNSNYYDEPDLLKKVTGFIQNAFRFHSELNVTRDAVISLGKENGEFVSVMNEKLKLFKKVIVLEHPRYIMQYKRKQMKGYCDKYIRIISSFL
ncbi:MAG TPA: uracil-DNA glycosylase family protein [Bacteroidia bacterium]|nr:uracil-DNA glycosylase family protein [Bacteroidia bacterium]